jgi:hypothetical protein
MAVRTRLTEAGYTGSRTSNKTGFTEVKGYVSNRGWIEDITLSGDNQPLTIEKVTRTGGGIYGTQKSQRTGWSWHGTPCTYMNNSYTTSPLNPIFNRPTDNYLATEVIARTNPSRSSTEALEYLGELDSLGSQAERNMAERINRLKRATRGVNWKTLRGAARANLMYQFGIAPLISDIEVLMGFQQLVDKRVEEIERLRTRGLRRTIPLWNESETQTIRNQIIHSNGVSLRADLTKTTTVQIRGHIRWRATSNWIKSDESMRGAVRDSILGARIDPTSIYELMPWSWLIDYFLNLGTMVKATRNNFDAIHDIVRIMTETTTQVTSSNHTTSGSGNYIVRCEPFTVTSVTKTRRLTTPSISAHTGFLQPAQWSILGSLGVLTAGRKPRVRGKSPIFTG